MMCMGAPPRFSAIFTKGNNFHDFLLAILEYKVHPKWGLLLKARICSQGSQFLPLRVDPTEKGDRTENDSADYRIFLFIPN